MILGFKETIFGNKTFFKEKILSGDKTHTIREDKNNRWKAGMSIQFATGVRTKNYNMFRTGECISTQLIEIGVADNSSMFVMVDKRILTINEMHTLAINDGFENSNDFFYWFLNEKNYYSFSGKIIHWTKFKY